MILALIDNGSHPIPLEVVVGVVVVQLAFLLGYLAYKVLVPRWRK